MSACRSSGDRLCRFRALAALVHVDESDVTAAAVRDVAVERVVGEIRFCADEPAERRELPFEHLIPGTKPGQLACGASPEVVRMGQSLLNPLSNDRRDDAHRSLPGETKS